MATATAAPAQAGQAPSGTQGGKTAPKLQPFRAGTQPTVQATGYVQTWTMSASPAQLPLWQIPANNILRCIWLEVVATSSGNSATVAFQGDAPLNVFQTVNFADAGGTSIVGSFDSYTLGIVQKYGGYGHNSDPRANAVYSVTTGSGGSGGSFTVVFRIPVEVVSRTGAGSLQNQSGNSPLTLTLTPNTEAAIYSTSPTSAPSVTVTARIGGYWKGSNTGAAQQPKLFGSTSYWNRTSYLALNGAVQQQFANIGMGNPYRNLILINYATDGARSDADFANPAQITFRGNNLVQLDQLLWKFLMSEGYGLSGATQDAALGLDTGVYVLPFNSDFGLEPGAELGDGYLMTDIGDALQILGTWAASSTLYEVVNFFAPKGGPATALQSGGG